MQWVQSLRRFFMGQKKKLFETYLLPIEHQDRHWEWKITLKFFT